MMTNGATSSYILETREYAGYAACNPNSTLKRIIHFNKTRLYISLQSLQMLNEALEKDWAAETNAVVPGICQQGLPSSQDSHYADAHLHLIFVGSPQCDLAHSIPPMLFPASHVLHSSVFTTI